MKSLTLFDYSDRELLFIIDEEALTEGEWRGWSRSADIAARIGLNTDNATSAVGSRFAWLKRYGAVTNLGTASGYWKLTPTGRALKAGDLDAALVEQLDGLKAADALMLTRYLGKRQHRAGKAAGNLMRREWQRETVRRRNGNG